jgi:non-specific serine/threonine protein kinase
MSLPDPGGNVAAEALTRHDATHLFLERWRAAGSRDEPDPEMLRTIAQICARLDGLPLAIELAAARAAVLSLPTLLARLTSRLKVLGGGPVDAPTRQQTLRGAIQWSYALLPPDRQALYRRVAVFAGGFTAEAAEAVCGDSLDGLIDLVDTSLLQPPAEGQKTPHFSLLATIREYAWELLEESGEAEDLRRRHAEYFTALAEELQRDLSTPNQTAAMARLRQEVDNLRAALEWCQSGQGSARLGLRLAAALLPYWMISGGGAEGRYWLDAMLPRAPEAPPAVQARAFHAAGVLARDQGDAAAAWPLLETALALYRAAGDGRGTADVLHAFGYRGLITGNYQQGIVYLEEALAMRRAAGDLAGIAETLGGLSSLYGLQNKDDEAIAFLREAAALRRELGDTWGLSVALATLGMTLAVSGMIDDAEPLLREGLPWQESLGDPAGTGLSFYGLSLVARQRGDVPLARDLCRKGIATWHEAGKVLQIGIPLREMAVIALLEDRAVVAAQLLGFVESHEKRLGHVTPPRHQRIHDATLADIRRVLPGAELDAAYRAGTRLSLDQAVELALA